MVDFLFALIEIFRFLLQFWSYEAKIAKCVQLGCFRRGRPLHPNFTQMGSFPINHSWHQKTRDTGLPGGEDRIPPSSLVLAQYTGV